MQLTLKYAFRINPSLSGREPDYTRIHTWCELRSSLIGCKDNVIVGKK